MYSLDLDVFTTLIDWLKNNKTAWLCTVTSTWGSAPRDVGSLMVCNTDGEQCGSLSGGCIEDDLLQKIAQGLVEKDRAHYILYGADPEEAERLQLPCGGTLGVLLEPMHDDEQTLSWLTDVQQHLIERKCITRDKNFSTGVQQLIPAANKNSTGERFYLQLDGAEPQHVHHIYGPQFHLFLIGISEVTRALARFALQMDYRVTVCDPRPEMIQRWTIENVTLVRAMPDDAVLDHANDARSAILALTHDPRIDDMGLLEAFNTPAFYIGAMGSLRTSNKRRDRLASLGIDEAALARLHAPIGLDIGSKTPTEIAISILAQLTQVRAQATPKKAQYCE